MKAASLATLKKELKLRSHEELQEMVLRLGRFKTENKELLTYLLFEAEDEAYYIQQVQEFISQSFEEINRNSPFYIRKSIRKILRMTKKYSRYSSEKETEVILLLHFCKCLQSFRPSITTQPALLRLFQNQKNLIEKKGEGLHEDLRYDYSQQLQKLTLP
ncbi:MAG: hypothetical protein R2793_05400 [Flavobacteriaceae bacterium]